MINSELIQRFQANYASDPINQAVENAVARVGMQEASFNNQTLRHHPFVFSHETKKGDITNQKSSGRCWMFAALNTARVDSLTKLNVESFEFSQNYPFFWDKLERANYFLNSIIETVNEPLEGRLVQHLLFDPISDGGQWDMFAGLLRKYGAVPKSAMPETFHSSNSRGLNQFITSKLREFAKTLRDAAASGASTKELEDQKEDMLYFVYNTLVKTLGMPPTEFTYEYRDRDNNFYRIENISPQDFFNDYVGWDLENIVSLINAPTQDKPYGRRYTVKYLGTVLEEQPINYINVPNDVLKEAAVNAIKNNEPVWFGCDVGKISDRTSGIMDLDLYQYDKTLSQPSQLDKAARLDYGDSLLTHAMVLVGVDLDSDGKPINWKVENSWGKDVGDKGIFSMSDAWFDQYTYQIAVNKQYIPEEWLKALDQPVIELQPWDPMGALAKVQ